MGMPSDEEAVAGETAIGFLAGVREASTPAGFGAAEAVAGNEVGHVLAQIVKRVFLVLESRQHAEGPRRRRSRP